MIQRLDWDSDFFGLTIGRTDIACPSVAHFDTLLAQKIQSCHDLLYVFMETPPDADSVEWMERHGGILADEKVIYEKNVPAQAGTPQNVREYNGTLTAGLQSLALASGHSSRFKIDPRLNHRFEDFYTLWMQKSVDKVLADKIFVFEENQQIFGFVTLKVKDGIGQIGLIAVDEQVRGRGIGRALIAACDHWLMSIGVGRHQVVTQMHNTGACALYEKCGFSQAVVQTIYHL